LKKLHILILRAYVGPFFGTFIIALFVLVMQTFWTYMDDLLGKGLDTLVIAEFFLYFSANLIPLALPLALLLSSIMTMGNLAESSELTAMKASGLSLIQILKPLIFLVGLISVGAFFFMNQVSPVVNLKLRSLIWDITQQKPALNIPPNVFYNEIDGYSIRVSDKDEKNNTLYDVIIYDHTEVEKGNASVIRAESGVMQNSEDERFLELILFNGNRYSEQEPFYKRENPYPSIRGSFEREIIRFDMSIFNMKRTDEELFKEHHEMLNMDQLKFYRDSLERKKAERKNDMKTFLIRNFLPLREDNFRASFGDTALQKVNTLDTLALPKLPKTYENATNLVRNANSYLTRTNDELLNRRKHIARFENEWHRKLTLSVACLILFFIGAPLGAIVKKGGLGIPVLYSIIFFLVFHVLSITGEKTARALTITSLQGMWLATFILAPIAIYLTFKSNNDQKLFEFSGSTKKKKQSKTKAKQ
jgi:lipopolysaccharide export system permease protein